LHHRKGSFSQGFNLGRHLVIEVGSKTNIEGFSEAKTNSESLLIFSKFPGKIDFWEKLLSQNFHQCQWFARH
jgi:hypothetical protein